MPRRIIVLGPSEYAWQLEVERVLASEYNKQEQQNSDDVMVEFIMPEGLVTASSLGNMAERVCAKIGGPKLMRRVRLHYNLLAWCENNLYRIISTIITKYPAGIPRLTCIRMEFPVDNAKCFWDTVMKTRIGRTDLRAHIIPKPVMPGDEISSDDAFEESSERSIDECRRILASTLTNVLERCTKETAGKILIGALVPRGYSRDAVFDDNIRQICASAEWISGRIYTLPCDDNSATNTDADSPANHQRGDDSADNPAKRQCGDDDRSKSQ